MNKSSLFFWQVILHYPGSQDFKLYSMLQGVWNIYMSILSLIMCIEISRQVTFYLMVHLGQRFLLSTLSIGCTNNRKNGDVANLINHFWFSLNS